jgi:hypothetical protein
VLDKSGKSGQIFTRSRDTLPRRRIRRRIRRRT